MAPKPADDLPDDSSSDDDDDSDLETGVPPPKTAVPPVKGLPSGGEGSSVTKPLLAGAGAPSDAPPSKPTTPRDKFRSKSQSTPRASAPAASGAADLDALAANLPDAEAAKKHAEAAKAMAGAAASELGQARSLTEEEKAALAAAAKEEVEKTKAAMKKLWEDMLNDRPPPCLPMADLSHRMTRYIDLLFDSIPAEAMAKIPPDIQPKIKPYTVLAIKIAAASSGWVAFIGRWVYRIWTMLPKNIVQILVGLALCYFGGSFMMTIAAAEAFRTMGAEKAIRDVSAIAEEVGKVLEANDKDDEEDLDGDGKADVDDLTPPQLLQRKALLVLMTVREPEKIQQAAASLYAAYLAVMAVLRLEFAQTVAMAIGVADMAKKPLCLAVVPVGEKLLPPPTHQWLKPTIESALQLMAIMIAMYIQQIISSFYSALRGGKLVAGAIFNILIEKAKVGVVLCPGVVGPDFDPDNSVLDEIIAWIIMAQGFYFQLSSNFAVPFPFSILLIPLTALEWYLRIQVVAGATGGGGEEGGGRRMEDAWIGGGELAYANCTCPVDPLLEPWLALPPRL